MNMIDRVKIYIEVINIIICFGVISLLYFRCRVMVRKWFILIRVIIWSEIIIREVESMKNIIRVIWIFL